jgi:tetratricopeptide (TPR) repeat protein
MMRAATLCCAFLLLLAPGTVLSQEHGEGDHNIGTVDFGVSCAPEVRGDLDRAVALLHHMMYVEARAAFERITDRAPECAMAHWGIGMTLFQPLWPSRPSPEDLRRGATAVRRAMELEPATDRERALVTAAGAFYRDVERADWWTRIRRWAAAMDDAYAGREADIETAALYALSQLAVAPVSENRMLHQARAAEVLLGIYDREPTHPGAIHYTIHANDVQGRADESLDVVRSYDDIAPSVPHALHMPTHIFVRLGAWPDVIEWNRKSADAALRFPAGDAISHHYAHATDYLAYAYLQQGADEEASAVMDATLSRAPHQGTFMSAFHLAALPARYAVERRAWEEAAAVAARQPKYLAWDRFWWPEAMSWFAKGLGAVQTGDLTGARAAEARMRALRDRADEAGEEGFTRYIETDRLVLAGWIAHAEGDAEAGVARLQEAAAVEASVEKHPVTPGTLYPPYEALGDLLLLLEQPAEALEAFAASLRIWPQRYHSLLGAARAARELGDVAQAKQYYGELLDVVGDANTQRSGVVEAKAFVSQ